MKRTLIAIFLVAALAGCAGPQGTKRSGLTDEQRRAFDVRVREWQERAAQPTPLAWVEGARWEFSFPEYETKRKKGSESHDIVVMVTNEPAVTCVSGEWRQLKVLDDRSGITRNPAYSVEGRNLKVLLSTGLCDVYDDLIGELVEDRFLGKRAFSHLLGGEDSGVATGHRITDRE